MVKLMVVKRNGELVDFDSERIRNAISKAVKSVGVDVEQAVFDKLVNEICVEVEERFIDFYPNVENIQDIVEKNLVKQGLYEIAKKYIIYRAERSKVREEEKKKDIEKAKFGRLTVKKRDGRVALFDIRKARDSIVRASKGYERYFCRSYY